MPMRGRTQSCSTFLICTEPSLSFSRTHSNGCRSASLSFALSSDAQQSADLLLEQWVPPCSFTTLSCAFSFASLIYTSSLTDACWQFFARSWAADKLVLNDSLTSMGARATSAREPLSLLICELVVFGNRRSNSADCVDAVPEGTLVSRDTRPISTKFSEKQQIVSLY